MIYTYITIAAVAVFVAGWLLGKKKPKWKPKSGDWVRLKDNHEIIMWIFGVQKGSVYYCNFLKLKEFSYLHDGVNIISLISAKQIMEPCPPPAINRPDYRK